MAQALCAAGVGVGSMLMTRFDWGTKTLGTVLFVVSAFALSSPAFADQTLRRDRKRVEAPDGQFC
jgi:Kef-type K+ transport system membrane component KefB